MRYFRQNDFVKIFLSYNKEQIFIQYNSSSTTYIAHYVLICAITISNIYLTHFWTMPKTHTDIASLKNNNIKKPINIEAMQKNIDDIIGGYNNSFILFKRSNLCFHQNLAADFNLKIGGEEHDKTSISRDLWEIRQLQLKAQGKKQDPNQHKILPIYNSDKRYFTPAFILGKDSIFYEDTPQLQYEQFIEKRQQAAQCCIDSCSKKGTKKNNSKAIQQIWQPKPRKSFCNVCKSQYQDYNDHIGSNKHKKKVRKNSYTKYIHQLVQIYKKSHRNLEKQCISQTQQTEQYQKNINKAPKKHKIINKIKRKLIKI